MKKLIIILSLLLLMGCNNADSNDKINYTSLCIEEKAIITKQFEDKNKTYNLLIEELNNLTLDCKQIELNYLVLNETYKGNLQEYKNQIIIKEEALEKCYRYNDDHNVTDCLDDLDECEDDLDDYKDDLYDCEDDLDECEDDLRDCK